MRWEPASSPPPLALAIPWPRPVAHQRILHAQPRANSGLGRRISSQSTPARLPARAGAVSECPHRVSLSAAVAAGVPLMPLDLTDVSEDTEPQCSSPVDSALNCELPPRTRGPERDSAYRADFAFSFSALSFLARPAPALCCLPLSLRFLPFDLVPSPPPFDVACAGKKVRRQVQRPALLQPDLQDGNRENNANLSQKQSQRWRAD